MDGFVSSNKGGPNHELKFIHCVILEVLTNASEELTVSIFRVKVLRPRRWMQYGPSEILVNTYKSIHSTSVANKCFDAAI
jgi:hypothetical protein